MTAMKSVYLFLLIIIVSACGAVIQNDAEKTSQHTEVSLSQLTPCSYFSKTIRSFGRYGFDFPVGKPDAKGYYNAQAFRKNDHLGDDWNGRGGGNTDLGDTIFAISNGYVTEAFQFYGGWGKVMRIASCYKNQSDSKMVESLYAHMTEMFFKKGQWVKRSTHRNHRHCRGNLSRSPPSRNPQ